MAPINRWVQLEVYPLFAAVEVGEKKVLKFEEVAKHNSTKDCWRNISGKVYDLIPFMDEHPGGDEVLLAATGKDVGHSNSAREMMAQYSIGDIRHFVHNKSPEIMPSLNNFFADPATAAVCNAAGIYQYLLVWVALKLQKICWYWNSIDLLWRFVMQEIMISGR